MATDPEYPNRPGGAMTRRAFVRTTALGAAGLTLSRARSAEEETAAIPDSAKVFVVHHKDVCPVANEYQPADPDVVKTMVGEAVQRMGGGAEVAEVVRGWCPEGKTPATARVKIKYCGLRGLFPAHAGVVNGIVRLLVEQGGIQPANIHVYERCAANFGEEDRPPYIGTPFAGGKNREPGVVYSHFNTNMGQDTPDTNHAEEIRVTFGAGQFLEYTFHYWDALENDTDILINVPVLKRHMGMLGMPKISIAMKNHFGSIRDPHKHHGWQVSTRVAAVNMARVIREKQRLVVVDALYAMYGRGPERGNMRYGINKLMVSGDLVAADYVGLGLINAAAEEAHKERTKGSNVPYSPFGEPPEIAIAAMNNVGHRAAKWQDHVVDVPLTS